MAGLATLTTPLPNTKSSATMVHIRVGNAVCGLVSKAQGSFLLSALDEHRAFNGVFRHRHLLRDRPALTYAPLFDSFRRAFEANETVTLSTREDKASIGIVFEHLGVEHHFEFKLTECSAEERNAFLWQTLCGMQKAIERRNSLIMSLESQLAKTAKRARPPSQPPKSRHPVTKKFSDSNEIVEPWRPVNTLRPELISSYPTSDPESPDVSPRTRPRTSKIKPKTTGWSFAMTEGKLRMQQTLLEQQAALTGRQAVKSDTRATLPFPNVLTISSPMLEIELKDGHAKTRGRKHHHPAQHPSPETLSAELIMRQHHIDDDPLALQDSLGELV